MARIMRSGTPTANAWESWDWVWSLVFFGSLILPLLLMAQEGALTEKEWSAALVLAVIGMIVHVVAMWGLRTMRTHVRTHTWYGLLYIGLLGIVTLALISINPTFSFMLSGFFSQLFFALPPMWAIPVATSSTVILGVLALDNRTFPALLTEPVFWLWVLGGITGSLIALWLNAIIDQSAERQILIDELHRAQADLAVAEREAGILLERQRLAREIHDTLAQGFISIITHLDAADQAFENNSGAHSHHLAQAQRTARTNLAEARRVVHDLRPEVLDDVTLPDALQRVAAVWAESSGSTASVYITGTVRALPADTEVTLLRVVQEALANIAKHANAHAANITLSYMPDRVLLDVQDNGEGLQSSESAPDFSAGFGLQSMRERVTNLGGSLLIESEPSEGTTLVVEVPDARAHSNVLADGIDKKNNEEQL